MSLVIPCKSGLKTEWIEARTAEFKKSLDEYVGNNQDVRDPYFIIFKERGDEKTPNIHRQVLSMSFVRPQFIRGTMVFWVDNSRGILELLWTVPQQGKTRFNVEAAKRLQGVLRVAN